MSITTNSRRSIFWAATLCRSLNKPQRTRNAVSSIQEVGSYHFSTLSTLANATVVGSSSSFAGNARTARNGPPLTTSITTTRRLSSSSLSGCSPCSYIADQFQSTSTTVGPFDPRATVPSSISVTTSISHLQHKSSAGLPAEEEGEGEDDDGV